MRILHVTHAYPRWEGDVSGAFVERLAAAQHARGHTVTVVAPADAERDASRDRAGGVSVRWVRYAPARLETLAHRGTMQDAARSPVGAATFAALVARLGWAARAIARRTHTDVVHAHWWIPSGLGAWAAGAFRQAPSVVSLHGTDVVLLDRLAPARFLARRVLTNSVAVAASAFLANRTAHWTRIPVSAIRIQPMPVDVSRFAASGRGGGGVVTVGRLTAQKRIHLAIEAVAKLVTAGRPVRLTVVGDGPERRALVHRAADLGVADHVSFAGTVAPRDVPALLATADVFVFPARAEGYGLAAAEAFLAGVPVIACQDGGGVTDIVPAEGAGRLVPPDDTAALARAIASLYDDPHARTLAGQRGAALRLTLAPAAVAAAYDSIYEGAQAKGTGRG